MPQLTFLHTLILITLIPFFDCADISWTLGSVPSEFGKKVYLNCTIKNAIGDCEDKILQWIGGSRYTPLCRNNVCLDTDKYEIMNTSERCSYTLMIKQFWKDDGNCDYTCLYGVQNFRKALVIDGKSFIYYPPRNYTHVNIAPLSKGKVNVSLTIEMVYPEPKCLMQFENLNGSIVLALNNASSGDAQNSDVPSGFSAHKDVDFTACQTTFHIRCFIGGKELLSHSENINTCFERYEDSNDNTEVVVVVILVVVVLLIAVVAFLIRKRIRRIRFRSYNESR